MTNAVTLEPAETAETSAPVFVASGAPVPDGEGHAHRGPTLDLQSLVLPEVGVRSPAAAPATDDRTLLKGMTLAELQAWVTGPLGERPYRAIQLYGWMYKRYSQGFEEMTDISKGLRVKLAQVARLDALELDAVYEASDGTKKLVFRVPRHGGKIESVWIPSEDRVTLCVSSQVGCALGCQFCLTAKMGLWGHLTSAEIVDQVVWARRLFESEQHLSNIVFMGMGEPLHNYDNVVKALEVLQHDQGLNFSHRKITVSTVGLAPAIDRLGTDQVQVNLAVSLNATTDEVRDRIMPINRRYKIATLLDSLERLPMPKRQRVTIEYVLLAGVNDSDEDAHRLAKLLRRLRCKVNLIPWNPHEGAEFARPPRERVEQFQSIMMNHNYNCRVRETRGDDRMAACGQLGGGAEGKVVSRRAARTDKAEEPSLA